jgi:Phage-related protein
MFNKNYAGEENRGKVYLTTANLKWIQLGLTARDLALLEGRSADLADVCNVYGVPKEIMSDQSGSSFNNKKEAEKKLWNDAILPHLDVLRDVLNAVWHRAIPVAGEFLLTTTTMPFPHSSRTWRNFPSVSWRHWSIT